MLDDSSKYIYIHIICFVLVICSPSRCICIHMNSEYNPGFNTRVAVSQKLSSITHIYVLNRLLGFVRRPTKRRLFRLPLRLSLQLLRQVSI